MKVVLALQWLASPYKIPVNKDIKTFFWTDNIEVVTFILLYKLTTNDPSSTPLSPSLKSGRQILSDLGD